MSSTHLHSHSTLQHPLSHPHAFLASTFPPTYHCMHPRSFTLVHVHPTNLCQLHPASHTHCVLTSWTTVDAAQPPPFCPNELSPHSMHQTLILAVKHCCTLWHLLHPQDLFWEHVPHGSSPLDSSRCIWTMPQVTSICPQHCAKLPMLYLTDFSLISIFCILNYSTIVLLSSNDTPSSVCVGRVVVWAPRYVFLFSFIFFIN